MADYYPLLARAISGLDRNTGEARRALYERARTALVAQLRGVTPTLEESEITRERLALEEAIRKVEAESARRARIEPQPAPPARPPAPRAEPPAGEPAHREARPAPSLGQGMSAPAEAPVPEDQPELFPDLVPARPATAPPPAQPPAGAAAAAKAPVRPAREAPEAARKPSLAEQALKGYREVMGAPEGAVEPVAAPPAPAPRAPRARRDPLAGIAGAQDLDSLEPRIHVDQFEAPGRDIVQFNPELAGDLGGTRRAARPKPPRAEQAEAQEEAPEPRSRPYGAIVKVVVALLILAVLGGLAIWQRGVIVGLYQAFRGQPAQVTRQAAPGQPKIADRIGPGATTTQPGAPAVAQRVVLYEEEASEPQGKRYVGSALWRTDTVSPGPGQAPELAIRADIEIPERRINMTLNLRRNTDSNLPASHTVEIIFNLPQDFAGGGIANVPGILMKQAEATRGVPLAGLAVKVTNGFFLIGLSNVDTERARNIALLKERGWFDVPIVYNNNKRAIIAIEKGTPGERAFADAFAAWKQ